MGYADEIVAIKIVELESLKSKKLEELLFSEIDVLKKLSHPNVLKCYEVFTSNRNCYIITELCNEGDLESRLRKDRYFEEYKAEPIIRDIFEGLFYLAEKNVIHRDLKVANVFLHNTRAKIADFGFAKFTKYAPLHAGRSSRTSTSAPPSTCRPRASSTTSTVPRPTSGPSGS